MSLEGKEIGREGDWIVLTFVVGCCVEGWKVEGNLSKDILSDAFGARPKCLKLSGYFQAGNYPFGISLRWNFSPGIASLLFWLKAWS